MRGVNTQAALSGLDLEPLGFCRSLRAQTRSRHALRALGSTWGALVPVRCDAPKLGAKSDHNSVPGAFVATSASSCNLHRLVWQYAIVP